ncbi:phage portal protein [Listeria seeligeri]|uniref:phage portal protein n=1 Tax=Listeria seeligeri TaxID=1640 RepID=UPI003A599016
MKESIKASNRGFVPLGGKYFFGTANSTLETNENIFSVVSKLSNTVASLPFRLYDNYEKQTDSFFSKLILNANNNQTLFEVFRSMEVARNTDGNGYALLMRDIRYRVEKIVPLNPALVEPMIDRDTEEIWYRVSNEGKSYYFYNTDIIHVKHIAGNGNIKGISPIRVLRNSIEFDEAVRIFSLEEMRALKDSFILTYDSNVDDERRAAIIEDFRRFYNDNGGVLFQEPGVTIERIEHEFEAADVKVTEEITRDRIANVYNVPAIFLNSDSDSFSSNEQLMQMFVNMTLVPIIKQYEVEFTKKVLTASQRKQGLYFKFNVNSLLRGDMETRSNFYSKALRDGWMTRDEVRELEDLSPVGGKASELWISGDMYPLDLDPALRKSSNESKNDVSD